MIYNTNHTQHLILQHGVIMLKYFNNANTYGMRLHILEIYALHTSSKPLQSLTMFWWNGIPMDSTLVYCTCMCISTST